MYCILFLLWTGVCNGYMDGNNYTPVKLRDKKQLKSYTCYEATTGVKEPVLTIIGTNGGNIDQDVLTFIQNNRVSYAIANGHRYCELTYQADENRAWSWQRFPLALAVLPCSDYVVFVDGDAVIVNNNYSFQPWIQQMEESNVDVLLAKDYVKESPVQFGVFMVKNTPWVYTHFEELYNICVCDWNRMQDWPREQGLIFDYSIFRTYREGPEANRTKIVPPDGWNSQANGRLPSMNKDQFVLHYAGCCYDRENKKWDFQSRWKKMIENYVEYHGNATGPIGRQNVHRLVNMCVPIYYKKMTSVSNYYLNGQYQYNDQSVMSLVTQRTGLLSEINFYTVFCTHGPHLKCNIPKFWHYHEGRLKNNEELLQQYGDINNTLKTIF
eukprot:TRINITY_DN13582_c0_g2_i4.p1 TRINITY_DN13582_c0_g2~~TRINITY_DN13582_c0_g2_i4.p1  ORF type:complete len:382 (-),score=8.60 TRINITY_DN13582_c0_g2_i4:329-1474(-)